MKISSILFWSILEWAVKFRWSLKFGDTQICSSGSGSFYLFSVLWLLKSSPYPMTTGENLKPEMSNPNSKKHNAVVSVFLPLSLSFVILVLPWRYMSLWCGCRAPGRWCGLWQTRTARAPCSVCREEPPCQLALQGRGISCSRSLCLLHHILLGED